MFNFICYLWVQDNEYGHQEQWRVVFIYTVIFLDRDL